MESLKELVKMVADHGPKFDEASLTSGLCNTCKQIVSVEVSRTFPVVGGGDGGACVDGVVSHRFRNLMIRCPCGGTITQRVWTEGEKLATNARYAKAKKEREEYVAERAKSRRCTIGCLRALIATLPDDAEIYLALNDGQYGHHGGAYASNMEVSAEVFAVGGKLTLRLHGDESDK